jgi:hypothetical protein
VKAIIESISGNMAILIIGEGNKREYVWRVALPKGTKKGDILHADYLDGIIAHLSLDEEETKKARALNDGENIPDSGG